MTLSLQSTATTARGGKVAILLRDNERFHHTFEVAAESPFAPGNHDRDDTALRQNIVFRANEELKAFFSNLDDWAISYITEHSERILGKQIGRDHVSHGFISNLKTVEGRVPLVKMKLNMPGSTKATRCWDQQGETSEFITDWVGKTIKISVMVSHLWIMGTGGKAEFGFVVLVTDAMEEKVQHEFPFGP